MTGSRPERAVRCVLRSTVIAMLFVYLFWNAVWLSVGRLPPSLALALLGLPSPTTGCTRSIGCMFAGEWSSALLLNPFTLPIVALMMTSVFCLAVNALRRRRVVLQAYLGWAWLAVLSAAWAYKLASPPECW